MINKFVKVLALTAVVVGLTSEGFAISRAQKRARAASAHVAVPAPVAAPPARGRASRAFHAVANSRASCAARNLLGRDTFAFVRGTTPDALLSQGKISPTKRDSLKRCLDAR